MQQLRSLRDPTFQGVAGISAARIRPGAKTAHESGTFSDIKILVETPSPRPWGSAAILRPGAGSPVATTPAPTPMLTVLSPHFVCSADGPRSKCISQRPLQRGAHTTRSDIRGGKGGWWASLSLSPFSYLKYKNTASRQLPCRGESVGHTSKETEGGPPRGTRPAPISYPPAFLGWKPYNSVIPSGHSLGWKYRCSTLPKKRNI